VNIPQVLSGGTIDEFAVLAMLMAGINAIPPLLFIVYLFTKGRLLHAAVWLGQLLNAALFIGRCPLQAKIVTALAGCAWCSWCWGLEPSKFASEAHPRSICIRICVAMGVTQ